MDAFSSLGLLADNLRGDGLSGSTEEEDSDTGWRKNHRKHKKQSEQKRQATGDKVNGGRQNESTWQWVKVNDRKTKKTIEMERE